MLMATFFVCDLQAVNIFAANVNFLQGAKHEEAILEVVGPFVPQLIKPLSGFLKRKGLLHVVSTRLSRKFVKCSAFLSRRVGSPKLTPARQVGVQVQFTESSTAGSLFQMS